jgi:hypothetical protein
MGYHTQVGVTELTPSVERARCVLSQIFSSLGVEFEGGPPLLPSELLSPCRKLSVSTAI